jgi:signal transduction histidine kinase
MRQVLLNILRNAVQAMPGGGTIVIQSRSDDKEVQISIQDSGPGLSADQINRVFDAFYTTKPTGSGLGLAISAQILRNHNGRLMAVPTDGKGAKFLICLPVAQKSA